MNALHFGIIGAGSIARNHVAAIKGTPDAELVAVATRNAERGNRVPLAGIHCHAAD